MQMNRWLRLSSSLWGIPLCDLIRKRIDQKKFSFIPANNRIVLAVQWSVKHFLDRNSPSFRKSGGEKKKKRGNYEDFFKQMQKL